MAVPKILEGEAALCEFLRGEGRDMEGMSDPDGGQAPVEALYLLTRMRFPPSEARRLWGGVVRHEAELDRSLGREVGLRVAVCDYFLNVQPPRMQRPVIVEGELLRQKEQSALVDDLTGLYNRRFFKQALKAEAARFERYGRRFSLIMLDVDFFKSFNDSYGHQAGDAALKSVASVLGTAGRSFDQVARYGGEEFAVILPQTDGRQALVVAERLRRAVAGKAVPVKGHGGVPLTVSLGAATFPDDADSGEGLVACADKALYRAKQMRNACCGFAERGRWEKKRPPLRLMVLCPGAEGDPARVSAIHVNFGGMLCASPRPILPGTQVEVLFDGGKVGLPHFSVAGRVQRLERGKTKRDYEIALSFNLGDRDERRTLRRLVELNQAAGSRGGVGKHLAGGRDCGMEEDMRAFPRPQS